jgi:hypothetical protein
MRKTTFCALVALGFGLLAGPAKAADIGVYGAYQDTKDADSGYGFGGKIDFARFLELRATYFGDVTADTNTVSRPDFKLRVVPLEAGLVYKFQPGTTFTPYLGGGATYFLLDTNRGDIDNELGWYAVVGTDIKTSRGFGLMLEGIYRSAEATIRDRNNGDTTVSDRVNVQLRGFGANAGLVWSF